MFQKVSGMEEKYEKEGVIMIFCRAFSVSQCQKISWVNPPVFQKISGMEESVKRKSITIFCREVSVSHSEKLRGGTLCV